MPEPLWNMPVPATEVTSLADALSIAQLARQLRVDAIRCSTAAGSGHPTSSLSAADLMAVLLANHLHYDWSSPKSAANDHLVFSKGHASPLLYAMFRAAGAISEEELLTTYRRFGSRLQGHPTPVLPWVDVATGSLGQGLPCAVGIALAGKYLDKVPFHTWVLCGDGEMAEGSMWEALDKAGYYGLSNLSVIVDVNRLGQRGPTELGWDLDAYLRRMESFGCRGLEVDGHDIDAIDTVLGECRNDTEHVCVVIARTHKGRGVAEVEDAEGWHGRAFPAQGSEEAIATLGGSSAIHVSSPRPTASEPRLETPSVAVLEPPRYEVGSPVATRRAFGDALGALAVRPEVVVLDGEVANSTYTEEFAAVCPERFFEMFIAEQQLLGAAVGFNVLGKKAYASTFAAFFTRAYDQIRMAAISGAKIHLSGSHAGVSIGEDGPSQMALEDLAMMRAVCDSTVLYPCDANQTGHLVNAMADLQGISYMRTTREKTPIIYSPDEKFPVGGSKVVRRSDGDRVAVVGAGVTLHEALKAHELLAREKINIRVIDAYSVKPIDQNTLHEAARDTQGRLVVVEDHWFEGGLGDAVLDAFTGAKAPLPRVVKLAVRKMPGSGTAEELRRWAGIDAEHIVAAVKSLLG